MRAEGSHNDPVTLIGKFWKSIISETSRKVLGTGAVWGMDQKETERLSCIFIHKFKVNVQFQVSIESFSFEDENEYEYEM